MQLALVVNPQSGSCDPEEIERCLREHGADLQVFDISELEQAAVSGAERMVLAAGDGGVASAAAAAAREGVTLAVIPAGTANDFARAVQIPDELEAACALAASGQSTRRIDLGRVNGERPFVNAASTGLSVPATRTADGLKRAWGPLAYLLGAIHAAATKRPVRCRVTVNGIAVFSGRAWQLYVSKTGAFGGGATIEDADPSDGRLHVTVLQARSRLRLGHHALHLREGDVTDQEGVVSAAGSNIEVQLSHQRAFGVDGELVTSGTVTRFTVEPGAFELVVPEQVTSA